MFTQSITPAMRKHMEVQMTFINELSRKMFDAAQKISELNMQVAQELLEEFSNTNQQLITANDPGQFASIASNQIQPTTERLRNYQQRISSLMANANAELTRTTESHMPEASRSASALADELVRTASEQTEQASQRQRQALERMNQSAGRGTNGMGQGRNEGGGASPTAH
jgi:phasin family protein